jgi:hypothetical protein
MTVAVIDTARSAIVLTLYRLWNPSLSLRIDVASLNGVGIADAPGAARRLDLAPHKVPQTVEAKVRLP